MSSRIRSILRHMVTGVSMEIQRQLHAHDDAQRFPPGRSPSGTTWKRIIPSRFPWRVVLPRPFSRSPIFAGNSKRSSGCRCWDIVTQIRMRMAKSLLLDENLRIEEISRRIGYETTSNFRMQFKRFFGIWPHEMRQGISGEAGTPATTEERRVRELAYWLREGWHLVLECDFTRTRPRSPLHMYAHGEYTGPCTPHPHFASFERGCLACTPFDIGPASAGMRS